MRAGTGVAVGGAVVLVVGMFVAPGQIAASYLAAYGAMVAVGVGVLLLVIAAHLSGAVWFVLLRRHAERVLGGLPALAVLSAPLITLPHAFWAGEHAGIWLSGRTVAYWMVWLAAAEVLRTLSFRQDRDPAGVPLARLRTASAAAAPPVALAVSFAAVDWVMAVERDWTSSVFGAYYFAGAMVSALALIAVLMRAASPAEWRPRSDHYQALGRLLLAFVLFWGYLWYAQFFIIWIADIPSEVQWYVVRGGRWADLGGLTVIAGFVAPLVVLLFRIARGSARVMAGVSTLLLVVHYLDVYWLVVPSMRPRWSPIDLIWDAAAVAFIGGATAATALWRLEPRAPVPLADPLLQLSARYEAH